MEVNDDAGSLTPRGALGFFASMLAPTVEVSMRHRAVQEATSTSAHSYRAYAVFPRPPRLFHASRRHWSL
ncbi:hypothetical protein PSUM_06240 [Pseudomonas umsongensis]|uniref:Uncharacterized protein n=1 Tax=Pseudomonas umsongensis TaxID=198618 RepID=A0ABX4E1G2_9PSED|nr:hypothetical protein PSUM_06240 [Pseudomonas umsongensis]